MFGNFSVFHFLIYATCLGFVVAIIYTNIQRTALSKFINHLVSNEINSEINAVKLTDIKLSSLEKSIIKSELKHQNGLKRCIEVIKEKKDSADKLEQALEGSSDNCKYYLTECDTDLLLKKYSFKTLETKYLVLFIAALIAAVIACTYAVDWLIKKVSIPEIENPNEEQTDVTDTIIDPEFSDDDENSEIEDSDNKKTDTDETDSTEDETTEPSVENEDNYSGPVVPY